MRLDGTITQTDERERRVNRFQKNSSYSVFLLTTQVGDVGLTLTAADRVVICKYAVISERCTVGSSKSSCIN